MNLSTVSRLPGIAVARNSPISDNVERFLRKMIENGLLGRYQNWVDFFVGQDFFESDEMETNTYQVIRISYIFRYFLVTFVIQIMVFIGELLCHRWQKSRRG